MEPILRLVNVKSGDIIFRGEIFFPFCFLYFFSKKENQWRKRKSKEKMSIGTKCLLNQLILDLIHYISFNHKLLMSILISHNSLLVSLTSVSTCRVFLSHPQLATHNLLLYPAPERAILLFSESSRVYDPKKIHAVFTRRFAYIMSGERIEDKEENQRREKMERMVEKREDSERRMKWMNENEWDDPNVERRPPCLQSSLSPFPSTQLSTVPLIICSSSLSTKPFFRAVATRHRASEQHKIECTEWTRHSRVMLGVFRKRREGLTWWDGGKFDRWPEYS